MANRKFMDTVKDENGNLHAIPFPENGKEGMPYVEVHKDENGHYVETKHEAGDRPSK